MKIKPSKLNRKQLLRRRRAVLLSELEAAAATVLADTFAFDETAVASFTDETRKRFDALPGNGDLPGIAVRFGLAGGQILKERHSFDEAMIDLWLRRLVATGQQSRGEDARSNRTDRG